MIGLYVFGYFVGAFVTLLLLVYTGEWDHGSVPWLLIWPITLVLLLACILEDGCYWLGDTLQARREKRKAKL